MTDPPTHVAAVSESTELIAKAPSADLTSDGVQAIEDTGSAAPAQSQTDVTPEEALADPTAELPEMPDDPGAGPATTAQEEPAQDSPVIESGQDIMAAPEASEFGAPKTGGEAELPAQDSPLPTSDVPPAPAPVASGETSPALAEVTPADAPDETSAAPAAIDAPDAADEGAAIAALPQADVVAPVPAPAPLDAGEDSDSEPPAEDAGQDLALAEPGVDELTPAEASPDPAQESQASSVTVEGQPELDGASAPQPMPGSGEAPPAGFSEQPGLEAFLEPAPEPETEANLAEPAPDAEAGSAPQPEVGMAPAPEPGDAPAAEGDPAAEGAEGAQEEPLFKDFKPRFVKVMPEQVTTAPQDAPAPEQPVSDEAAVAEPEAAPQEAVPEPDSSALATPSDKGEAATDAAPKGTSDPMPAGEAQDPAPAKDKTKIIVPQQQASATMPDADMAYRLYAAKWSNPDNKPLFVVVLIDKGVAAGGIDPDSLAALPFAVTIAVDPLRADAAHAQELYRSGGGEVAILATDIPAGATAADLEVIYQSYVKTLPEAVALMPAPDATFMRTSLDAQHIAALLASDGRGLITYMAGLNAGARAATKEGVPVAAVEKLYGQANDNAGTLALELDRAAFSAEQKGSVVVALPATPEAISALMAWAAGPKAQKVAIAPASALMLATP